jgi:hypothetical protein
MDWTDFRVILLGLVICTLVFSAEYIFGLGAISVLYIFFMLLTFWLSKKAHHIFGSVLVSMSLTMIGWLFQSRLTQVEIEVGPFHSMLDYEGLFRVFTVFILVFLGAILIRQKNKEFEINKLNESLEFRILAKTVASEARAMRMEQQIKVLQLIRSSQVDNSIKKLDDVITELKKLNDLEAYNA